MNTPLLTIRIPTYNRPKSIVSTVRALLPQLNDKVVLKVYDNCSDPSVAELFTDEEKKRFTIIRNKANIGGDANICGVIYNADTKWVWDLGDDDGPLPDAIETILGTIAKYPNALFFKFNSYIEKDLHTFEGLCELHRYKWIFNNFLFISSGIYNRDKLIGDIQHFYVNLSSMVGQTIFVLKHLERQKEDFYFFSKKIVQHSVGGMQEEDNREIERGHWDPIVFIKRSSILFDTFKEKRNFLNKTLYVGVATQYLSSIGGNDMTISHSLKSLHAVIKNIGFYNLLRYNSSPLVRTLVKIILYAVLPDKLYQKIRVKNRAKVNSKMMSKENQRFKKDLKFTSLGGKN